MKDTESQFNRLGEAEGKNIQVTKQIFGGKKPTKLKMFF